MYMCRTTSFAQSTLAPSYFGERGYEQFGRSVGLASTNLTLFQTKIYDFPYILDQTQNLIH